MLKFLVIVFLYFPVFSFSQFAVVELEARNIPEPVSRDLTVDNWNRLQPGYVKLPPEAKDLLYWTNYSRNNPQKFWDSAIVPILTVFPSLNKAEAKSLYSDLSKANGLSMFALNEVLISTAQAHADDIGKKKAPIGHNSSNGTDFGTRMKKAGIRACANENISLSSQSVLLSLILLYLDIGLSTQGHRKTLLDPVLKEIGIGSVLYGQDQHFLVQDLACAQH